MNTNLPDNWKIVHVDDICLINKNTLSEKSADFQFKYIDLSSVKNGKILCSAPISFKESPSRARRIIRKNDIIMSTVRPNLQGFAHIDFDAQEYICSTGFAVLTVKPNTSSKFIYYCLYSKSVEMQINNMLVGSNYPAINSSDVASLKIFLPPLPEQEKIAGILSCWDDGIEKLSQLIDKKKLQKKALMQQLLTGKRRLKGFSTPWHEVRLGDVLYEHKETSKGDETICSVSVHKGIIIQIEHLGRSFAASNTSNYNLVHYGNVVYTKSPTGEFPYGIFKQSQQRKSVIVSPLYGVFTPKTYYLGYILDVFFSYAINLNNYLKPIIQKGAKNTINITNETFLSKAIFLPGETTEIQKLAEIFIKADEEIELLNKKLEAFKQEKKALMQQLLTGKIRVKVN
mgnify:CR=1 FL=1|jgi:Restriction endonuclease S subunits